MVGRPLIDRVSGHFKSQLDFIEIPEWGEQGEPLKLYCTPITLQEQRKIIKAAEGDEFEGIARIIILKATDEKGEPLFDISHLPTLMRGADAKVVERIANFISHGVKLSAPVDDLVEETVGNS